MSNPGTRVGALSPSRETSDGQNDKYFRLNRDGSLYVVDHFESLAEQGRVFASNHGTLTTPLTFLALATNRPDAWIRNPSASGVFAKPMRIKVALEAAAGTVTEIEVRLSKNDIGNGTSTAASLGPVSTRTDSGYTAACIPRHLATGDTTAETTPVTLWRSSYPFAQATAEGNDPLGFEITREMLGNPVMDENSSLIVFISATTTQATGFVVFQWAEVPVNDLS